MCVRVLHHFLFFCVGARNQTLDLLIGDGPLLDYYRGADSTCNLIDVSNQDKIGDDTYAVAMTKGFPLKVSFTGLHRLRHYCGRHCKKRLNE